MRITSKLFESSDLETKKELLHTTQVYHQVAELYEKFVLEFSGKQFWFLTSRMKDDTLRKRYKQCEKLVDIALELNAPFDVYLKVQFEILVPFFKKVNPRAPYPQFYHLISEKAIARFKEHSAKLKERFTGTKWMDEYLRTSFVDIGKSILNSARKFYDRLKSLQGVPIDAYVAVDELEMLARAGVVTNVYICSSPIVKDSQSAFLIDLQKETDAKMTDSQKFLAKRARDTFITEFAFEDKEIAKYV